MTTTLEKFDPKRLSVTEFQTNERSKGQQNAYLRYHHPTLGEDSTLLLQTDWITLESGGVPKPNPDYYANDKARAFMRLPVEEGSVLFTKMQHLDKMFTSDSFKTEKFGSKGKKYSMFPIVKIPEQDEDDERTPLPPSMKIKFDLHYDEEDQDACKIKTQVYLSTEKDGKRTREKKEVSSLQEMEELVRLGSKLRLIIRPVKMWASPKKEYGVIWKLIKLEVEPSSRGSALMQAFYDNDGFLDSDEEEEVEVPQQTKDDSDVEEEEDEDDEEEEEEDEDEEEEEESPDIPVKSKKTKGKSGKSKNL